MNRTAVMPAVASDPQSSEARVTFHSRTNPLAGLDELIRERTAGLVRLIADRRSLADVLIPARTPLDESEEEQLSHAAFSLALSAMEAALDKTPNRTTALRALRSAVALYTEGI
ncbi:hypothetical protein ACIOZL_19570 [Streptomyces sp. NPDC087769]|uniref:hypothetical protein n=1 Tax=Streptomyces sp. NPDC087769 TaxID=3365802 RepID=UPI0038242C70